MFRNVGSVVVGLVLGLIGTAILSAPVWAFHPMRDVFMEDSLRPNKAALEQYFNSMPVLLIVFFLAGNAGKYFIGGCIAGLITKSHVKTVIVAVALIYLGLGYFDPYNSEAPWWMFFSYPLYIIAIWLAILVVSKRNKAIERNRTSTRIQ